MTESERRTHAIRKVFTLPERERPACLQRVYETLGFDVRGGNEAGHWFLITYGAAYIGLFQGIFEQHMLTFIPTQDRNGQQLPTFTDIRDMQKQLKEAGIAFEQEAEDGTEPARFLILDPDGNPIMVDQHVARSQ